MTNAKPRPITFGMIVGNRGFFPDHLAKSGREDMIAAIEKAGFKVVTVGLNDTKYGAIESRNEAACCADLFKKHREDIDGVIVTLGLVATLSWARERGRLRLAGGLAAVALVAPVLDQLTLFPYQYTYANAAFDATGQHLQSDYWRTSVPELLPQVPTDGQVVCGPTRSSTLGALAGSKEAEGIDRSALVAGRFSSDSSVDCREDPLGPLSSAWAAQGLPYDDALPHDAFYAIIDRDHELPSNCSRLAGVTRDRHLRAGGRSRG